MSLFGVGIKPKKDDKGNGIASKIVIEDAKNQLLTQKNKVRKESQLLSHFVNSP
jgi:hypothetical protein